MTSPVAPRAHRKSSLTTNAPASKRWSLPTSSVTCRLEHLLDSLSGLVGSLRHQPHGIALSGLTTGDVHASVFIQQSPRWAFERSQPTRSGM